MGFAPHFGVRPIGVRHEQAAVFAAAGYGYVNNSAGVAVLASGPGVTNGMTGAHVAWDNCFPVVVLGGSSNQKGRGTGQGQEAENVPMYKGITKMAVQVDSTARIPEYMAMAFRKAQTGRPGPVYLDLPSDVLETEVDEEEVRWPTDYYTDAAPLGDPTRVKRAAEVLLKAERPMLIVGKGVRWSEPVVELRRLVERLGMPFITSPMGRGFIPDDHPLNFHATRSYIMRHADVVLVVGARLNWMFDMGRQFPPEAKIIQIDIQAEEIGANRGVHVGIVGDAKAVLQQLLAELEGKTAGMAERAAEGAWLSELRKEAGKNEAALEPALNWNGAPLRTHRLLREVREVFPRETIYTVDGQTTLAAGRQVLPSFTPASRLNAGSNACMGVGVPFAIGAKLARPNAPVVSVNGDCSFGFNGMEVETAIRHKLPIVFIINNNAGIVGGQVEARMGLPKDYPERVATYDPNIRYDLITHVFGGHPEHVTQPEQIRPALERAFEATRRGTIACVNVVSDPMEPGPRPRRGRASSLLGY